MKPYFAESGITIYHADSRDVLPSLSDVDLTLTDPPYGVMLGEAKTGQEKDRGQHSYTRFSDTPEYIEQAVIPIVKACLQVSQRLIVTPGNRNAWLYPKPNDVGVWYNPAGTGRGKWGFVLAHLILYYGVDPYAGRTATASSAWGLNDSVSGMKNVSHPCPKPLKFVKWLVGRGSRSGDLILDPFMGSGTTLVAAKDLGRRAIGIEIEEKYCELAANRLRQSVLSFEPCAARAPDLTQERAANVAAPVLFT